MRLEAETDAEEPGAPRRALASDVAVFEVVEPAQDRAAFEALRGGALLEARATPDDRRRFLHEHGRSVYAPHVRFRLAEQLRDVPYDDDESEGRRRKERVALLEEILAEAPRFLRADEVLLARAGLAHEDSHAEARAWYRRLEAAFPRSPCLAKARESLARMDWSEEVARTTRPPPAENIEPEVAEPPRKP